MKQMKADVLIFFSALVVFWGVVSCHNNLPVQDSSFVKSLASGNYILPAPVGWWWKLALICNEQGKFSRDSYYMIVEDCTERPHILWKDGEPECLFLACHDEKAYAGFFLKIIKWE